MASLAVPTTTRLNPIFFKNDFKQFLKFRVIIHHQYSWLALFILAENISIE